MGRKKKIATPVDEEAEKIARTVIEKDLSKLVSSDVGLKDASIAISEAKRLKDREYKLRRFLIPVLRRATFRWKERGEAIKAARKERGVYECAICKGSFKNGQFVLDHTTPAVSIKDGWVDFNTFIDRLFCEKEQFQVLCVSCHDAKTSGEDAMRKFYSDKKKEDK